MLSAGMNNAVFPAIHPPPVEDGGLLAHGVLKDTTVMDLKGLAQKKNMIYMHALSRIMISNVFLCTKLSIHIANN